MMQFSKQQQDHIMRTTRKRLTCVNRDNNDKNHIAIDKIMKRYIKKMKNSGWYYYYSAAARAEGDSFFVYERYITIYKPNLRSLDDLNTIAEYELQDVLEAADLMGVNKDGVWVLDQLKDLGWNNVRYVSKSAIVSTLNHRCDSGSHQQSKLVKVFYHS